jgi:choline dehydrogenase-like flavoprotein
VATGRVQLRSAVPYAKPRIRHNYLTDPSDHALLRTGVRMAMHIARQAALGDHVEDLDSAARAGLAPASDTDEAIDEFIRDNAFSFYHPAGSCALGKVVDHELRVHGLANVRIADASVIPTGLRGNLNAPAIMIGERVGDFILGTSTGAAAGADSRRPIERLRD